MGSHWTHTPLIITSEDGEWHCLALPRISAVNLSPEHRDMDVDIRVLFLDQLILYYHGKERGIVPTNLSRTLDKTVIRAFERAR